MVYTVLERKELYKDDYFRCMVELNRDKNGYVHFVYADTIKTGKGSSYTNINEIDDKLYLSLIALYGGVSNELNL